MKIHELKLTSAKNRKRVGRGISAGQGKTAGRGTKGQNSRTGGGVRPGFEGGQNPLAKRLPKKRGFVALNHKSFQVVNLAQLNKISSTDPVDNAALHRAGLVKHADRPVKILGLGKLDQKLTLKVQAASRSAAASISKNGGQLEIVSLRQK